MIKVIASDMDGTLLNNNHTISDRTKKAIKKACKNGFRFMVITGRNYVSAWQELRNADLECDYIVGSGAEVRNPQKEIVRKLSMNIEDCDYVNTVMEKYNIAGTYCTEGGNYIIGSRQKVENSILAYIHVINPELSIEEMKQTRLYSQMWERTMEIPSFSELLDKEKEISKIFLASEKEDKLIKIREELKTNENIAVSWSSSNNLEITDHKAQKGPVLKEYIESLGYSMEEVMVLGDSMNDYSMMCMNFGATVAMENADPMIKKIAKYITKSNEEDGVAYIIEKMMEEYGIE